MKTRFLEQILTAASIALATALISQATYAEGTTFFCGVCDGVPITYARTARGYIPIIRWVSDRFSSSGYTPEKRCQEVTARFQTYYNNDTLNYITAGRMNGQSVVCVADRSGGGCKGLLFTLKPESDANSTVRQLFAIRDRASAPLEEVYARVYINMNEYLNAPPPVQADRMNSASKSPSYCQSTATSTNPPIPDSPLSNPPW